MDKISEDLLRRFGFLPTKRASRTSTAPINLPPSLALLAPTFPTFSALATANAKPEDAGSKRGGLFSALLKDPMVLLQDLLASPGKYQEGVFPLVQDLVSGRRKLEGLSKDETELLDRATIDFSRADQPKKVEPVPAPKVRKGAPSKAERPAPKAPSLDGLEPYWWLA